MSGSDFGPLRIGIDVGGTFTDVVVVDARTRTIRARHKVPTTHDDPAGVAAGIVAALDAALATPGLDVARIAFLAHSTTQATNALLEGDVARVGIVGLLRGFSFAARTQLRLSPIVLGARRFAPQTVFATADDPVAIGRALDALVASGVEAIVASEAFGVDHPSRERATVDAARARGLPATAGHEVASSYGLRARTRTAALNAAILPRMVRTSESTARAVATANIRVPLMIMRSDGGVMDVAEVARRPILTMLSGPAAGIAGALLHENVTDGIFIEVGGTSADCSVIRRGAPQLRPARVGGHRTMLRTLDVRTLAIAGGSLARIDLRARGSDAMRGVGPRSAHIAGLRYACFTEPAAFAGARVVTLEMEGGEQPDYVAIVLPDGTRIGLTPTCAANLLDFVPEGDFARGSVDAARAAFALVGTAIACDPAVLARLILDRATAIVRGAIDELVADYELDAPELIGGGGGAAALVPYAARQLRLPFRLARDAEVISPLGVALALVRDVVERTIVAPTAADVVAVRREAFERVVATGAAPDLVDVVVEIDSRRNLVRATASGASAAAGRDVTGWPADASIDRVALAAAVFDCDPERVVSVGASDAALCAFEHAARRRTRACVIDRRGVVRLRLDRAVVVATSVGALEDALAAVLDATTAFGDVGRALPEIHLVYRERVVDLGTLAEAAHLLALASEEVRGLDPATEVIVLAARRDA